MIVSSELSNFTSQSNSERTGFCMLLMVSVMVLVVLRAVLMWSGGGGESGSEAWRWLDGRIGNVGGKGA